jgi:hypothetical protein
MASFGLGRDVAAEEVWQLGMGKGRACLMPHDGQSWQAMKTAVALLLLLAWVDCHWPTGLGQAVPREIKALLP